jgi:hypothetical protein
MDVETGFLNFRMRMYSPEQGRFASRDPLGYVDGLGLHEAFGGNPGNRWDPWGLQTLIIPIYVIQLYDPDNINILPSVVAEANRILKENQVDAEIRVVEFMQMTEQETKEFLKEFKEMDKDAIREAEEYHQNNRNELVSQGILVQKDGKIGFYNQLDQIPVNEEIEDPIPSQVIDIYHKGYSQWNPDKGLLVVIGTSKKTSISRAYGSTNFLSDDNVSEQDRKDQISEAQKFPYGMVVLRGAPKGQKSEITGRDLLHEIGHIALYAGHYQPQTGHLMSWGSGTLLNPCDRLAFIDYIKKRFYSK